jgi:hypothetical protein
MRRWDVDSDVLVSGALRLALQRIGRSHWRPRGVLRSWGLAPLYAEGERVCVPCGDNEVLWIGAWLEPRTEGKAAVTLADVDLGLTARVELPAASQITALSNGQPIARRRGQLERLFRLTLEAIAKAPVCIDLVFVKPRVWAARSSRPTPPPLRGPPPPPPRLG